MDIATGCKGKQMKKDLLRREPTETQFLAQVISLANLHGWLAAHFRPGLTKSGRWVTAVQGDGKGFPDLVLVRDRLVVAELKVGRNKTTPEQDGWLQAFRDGGVEAYTWWPRDWETIEEVLK
jgi:hypothetical protein